MPILSGEKQTRSNAVAGTDVNGNKLTSSNNIDLVDYVVPFSGGPNHGTPTDPKRVLCDASLLGQLCQVCPDHIVCLGGAWSIPPRISTPDGSNGQAPTMHLRQSKRNHDLERDYWDLHEDYEELEEELQRLAERFYREQANLSLRYRQSVEECERLRRTFEALRQDFDVSARENAALQQEVDQWRTGFEELYAYTSRCKARIAALENVEAQPFRDVIAGTTSLNRQLTDMLVQDDAVRSRQLEAPSTVDDSNRFSDGTSTTIDDFD
ncbi:hypothetical protein AAVH_23390 [Aphelenchoides avenae]|nr:hypothetical protein AAVH_23390 [Aphelenchus avenae]